ncbi:inorganic phosphate transporter [Streptomyces sp. 3N207]|uniref:inorganic phosphate transporter n=1 Tax=Streptomyces sp. 3N207 TaxID=3457417 RepID=UPI003FD66D05
MELAGVIAIIVVALIFDFTNGFHDAANAIATSVSTRALTPRVALAMAAVMNLIGAHMGTGVAKTVGSGIIETPTGSGGLTIVASALVGAIGWNLLTWRLGLPTSSSHALIGGLIGAALAAVSGVQWMGVLEKVAVPMLLSPLLGFLLSYVVMVGILWLCRRANPRKAGRRFRFLQTLSAAAMGLGHGLQDAQKTMGVIVLALVTAGYQSGFEVPEWVIFSVAAAMALGTYSGGWRIIRTLGRRIVQLDPPRGFAAEATASTVLYATAFIWKVPISTTQTITSAVMGAGATRRFSAVRWGVARNIVIAWGSTLPGAGLAAAAVFWILHHLLGI